MSHHPWIPHAARRAEAVLRDGSSVVLVGVPMNAGHRVRVEFPGGRRRTVAMTDVVWVDTAADRTDVSGNLEATGQGSASTDSPALTSIEPDWRAQDGG